MKKIVLVLLLAAAAVGCGTKPQRVFTVINQSDWRAVVTVTNSIDNVGNTHTAESYVIGSKNDLRGVPATLRVTMYDSGDCTLASVNGAKVKSKTDTLLVLENAPPVTVKVINQTGKDIVIKNEPWLGDIPVDFYYGGSFNDQYQIMRDDYQPLFTQQLIAKDRTEDNPVSLPMYAWQLFEITDQKNFAAFAAKSIMMMSNVGGLHAAWERAGDAFFLRITNE